MSTSELDPAPVETFRLEDRSYGMLEVDLFRKQDYVERPDGDESVAPSYLILASVYAAGDDLLFHVEGRAPDAGLVGPAVERVMAKIRDIVGAVNWRDTRRAAVVYEV